MNDFQGGNVRNVRNVRNGSRSEAAGADLTTVTWKNHRMRIILTADCVGLLAQVGLLPWRQEGPMSGKRLEGREQRGKGGKVGLLDGQR